MMLGGSDLETGHGLWGVGVPEDDLPVLACCDGHLVDLAELESVDGSAVPHEAADDRLALAVQHGQAAVYGAGEDVLQRGRVLHLCHHIGVGLGLMLLLQAPPDVT